MHNEIDCCIFTLPESTPYTAIDFVGGDCVLFCVLYPAEFYNSNEPLLCVRLHIFGYVTTSLIGESGSLRFFIIKSIVL